MAQPYNAGGNAVSTSARRVVRSLGLRAVVKRRLSWTESRLEVEQAVPVGHDGAVLTTEILVLLIAVPALASSLA